jgi:hypothetical protein
MNEPDISISWDVQTGRRACLAGNRDVGISCVRVAEGESLESSQEQVSPPL